MNKMILSIMALLTFTLSSVSNAEGKAVDVKSDMIQLEPWAFETAPGKYDGLVVDFLKEYEKLSGNKVTMSLTPYSRVDNDLKEGTTDFSVMAWGPQRAEFADKLIEFFPLEFGVFPVKGTTLKDMADLQKAGVVISVTRALKVQEGFDKDTCTKEQDKDKAAKKAVPCISKEEDTDYAVGIKKAADGRVTAVAGAIASIRYNIKKLKLEDKFGEPLVLKTTPASVTFSKKSANYANKEKIKAIFQMMVDNGFAKEMDKKWLK